MPWPVDQAEIMLNKFSKEIDNMEAENGIKVVYPNSLNIVYSKVKDKFFLCNLQNILMEREFQKIMEIEKSTICDI